MSARRATFSCAARASRGLRTVAACAAFGQSTGGAAFTGTSRAANVLNAGFVAAARFTSAASFASRTSCAGFAASTARTARRVVVASASHKRDARAKRDHSEQAS